MKVLAINGSPHGENGATAMMLKPLLEGMAAANAETEIIYLSKLKMQQCLGCFNCWFKTPGKCMHNDDVAEALEKYAAADLIIFATPLYVFNVSGLMKTFLDRSIPLALPFMEENSANAKLTRHPQRHKERKAKMLLLSPCGFPEYEHFPPLTFYMKFIAKEFNYEYLGEILRPAAGAIKVKKFKPLIDDYLANLKIAGKQLIEQGAITKELHDKLHELWLTPEEYRQSANARFQEILDRGV